MTTVSLDDSEAAATAEAMPGTAEQGVQRGRVHPRRPAGPRAGARVRDLGVHAAAALRKDKTHGAPWEEAPPPLSHLRQTIHHRAAVHSAVPLGKGLYLACGYLIVLPVSAVAYAWIWIHQSPARATVAYSLDMIMHATRVPVIVSLHAPFVSHLPVIGRFF